MGIVMFENMINLIEYIPGFVAIMAQVVSIWGFLNFINQLSLQNATSVADRALGRLPGLRTAINSLRGDNIQDCREIMTNISDIYKRLFVDLKQLGIAKKYEGIKNRLAILLQKEKNIHEAKNNYLEHELGGDWQAKVQQDKIIAIDFIDQLENELMNIFDMSYAGQNFISHLSRNIMRVSWLSLVVYLISCQNLVGAGYTFVIGVILFGVLSIFQD